MQKINPIYLDVEKYGLSWMKNAFDIYKSGFWTHTAIFFLASFSVLVTLTIESFIPEEYHFFYEWLLSAFFSIFLCVYFTTYIIGIVYKYDKGALEFDIGFDKETIIRFIKVNWFFFILSVVFYAIDHLFSLGGNANGDTLDINAVDALKRSDIRDLMLMTSDFIFQHSHNFLIFCFLMLYVYMKKDFLSIISLIRKALVDENNLGLAIFIIIATLMVMSSIAQIGGYSFLVYFFFVPYLTSLYYVIFKHMFFGEEPTEREEKEGKLSMA